MLSLVVDSTPENYLTFGNRIFVSREDFRELSGDASTEVLVSISTHLEYFFTTVPHDSVPTGRICLNSLQRRTTNLALDTRVNVSTFSGMTGDIKMDNINLTVDLMVKDKGKSKHKQLKSVTLSNAFRENFLHQVFTPGQILAMKLEGLKLLITVESVCLDSKRLTHGILNDASDIRWTKQSGSLIDLEGQLGGNTPFMCHSDFDFEKMGIGGLGKEFNEIFRRAFSSRIFDSSIVREMGIHHVRGMLLYGPPGCGKTLIARKIGQVLNSREPKIVNGPEILDKYVGGSEAKIRALFADAEKEEVEKGDESMLHIIILDEIDAICKTRGSVRDNTGVSDSIVNQLLSKIDGVDSLNNILIIGMTNRKEMIDDALLRPGRLEVHVEIGLPDKAGRLQILDIHTRGIIEKNRMDRAVINNMDDLAMKTKNYTGAEIEGVVRSAASFAFMRGIDVNNIDKKQTREETDPTNMVVQWDDFQRALVEVKPKFGTDNQELDSLFTNGIISYGKKFEEIQNTIEMFIEQIRTSDRTPIMSVLLEGDELSGKTALMAYMASKSEFPFIRKISADEMIGMGEASKVEYISSVFLDSYKSSLSIILIDDLERVIDFVRTGPRFSNTILQTLLVLLKKPPPHQNRLLVMSTTSISNLLEDLMLVQAFMVSVHVPLLEGENSIRTVLERLVPMSHMDIGNISRVITDPIGIKKLLMVVEMARNHKETFSSKSFEKCLQICG